jgi:hypothetical protein
MTFDAIAGSVVTRKAMWLVIGEDSETKAVETRSTVARKWYWKRNLGYRRFEAAKLMSVTYRDSI